MTSDELGKMQKTVEDSPRRVFYGYGMFKVMLSSGEINVLAEVYIN